MSIEEELFKKRKLNINKLIPYGFIKENDIYKYTKSIINNSFKVIVTINKNGQVKGKVYDLETEEEYTLFRLENLQEFASKVKEEYINILTDIANNCFTEETFIFDQTNRINKLIGEEYQVNPEFLWEKFPGYGVFRSKRTDKWFGAIMNIDKSKISPSETGEIEVLNVKLGEETSKYLKQKGIYPAYHFKNKSWVSIILDDTLTDKGIMKLIKISYELADNKEAWIFPANPKYYDIMGAFDETDTITWWQPNNIINGDTVYLYITKPYQAIMFKCMVVDTNLPYDKRKIMKIKLLKRYSKDEFTFEKLKESGVTSVRSPRRIPLKAIKKLNLD